MLAMRLLEVVVVLRRFVKQLGKSCDVGGLRFPLASGKSRRDLLKQPAVTIRIRERRKREIRTTFRVAPGNARVLHGVVHWSPSEMKDLAHCNAAGDQVAASGIDVVHSEDQVVLRCESFAENDR